MSVNRRIRLNLRNFGNLPAIMLSQYDEGYNLVFEIFDGASAAGDLSGYTATLKGVRSDTLSYSFTGTISNNVLTFEIDTTMTGVAGKGTAEIVLTASGVVFATFNMPVFVEKAAVPDGSIDADVTRAEEVAEQIQQIVDTAAEQVTAETEQIVADLSEDVSGVINMTVSAQTLAQGASATVTKTEDAEGIINLDFGLPLASGEVQVVNVSGSNPTITAEYNKRYVCGEVSTLTITPASQGCTDVVFTSGTTPTVLSLPQTVKMPSWFTVEANKTYEISILDGVYGAVMSWT